MCVCVRACVRARKGKGGGNGNGIHATNDVLQPARLPDEQNVCCAIQAVGHDDAHASTTQILG